MKPLPSGVLMKAESTFAVRPWQTPKKSLSGASTDGVAELTVPAGVKAGETARVEAGVALAAPLQGGEAVWTWRALPEKLWLPLHAERLPAAPAGIGAASLMPTRRKAKVRAYISAVVSTAARMRPISLGVFRLRSAELIFSAETRRSKKGVSCK